MTLLKNDKYTLLIIQKFIYLLFTIFFVKNNFKNDFLYYSNVMNIKAQKETKQKNIQTAFIVNESAKRTNYSKQSIEKLLQEFY